MEKKRSTYTDKLVSVIMPMHNSSKFLGEAIESVIHQKYHDWELLIVDDNSTDDSVSIARKYAAKDSRIQVLRNDRPIGMPSAPRNYGVKHARGRYIAFLDSDDMWLPYKLSQQIPLFRDPRVAIVYSNYEKTDERGIRNSRIIYAPRMQDYRGLLKGNIIGNLTGVYDTYKVGKITIKDIHHEDFVMWLSILKKGFIAKSTDTVTAAYRITTGSVSASKFKILRWQWDVYRKSEQLSVPLSAYYYINYAIRALIKRLK